MTITTSSYPVSKGRLLSAAFLISGTCVGGGMLALEVSGGFGDGLLSGVIPALMVWIGRYRKNLTSSYQVAGGKGLLIAIFFCSSYVLIIQWIKLIN